MTLPLSPVGRRYGYRKDKADFRDFGMHRFSHFAEPIPLPAVVDLEPFCGPVRDQGQQGSCTAHAGVGVREFLARKYQPSVTPPPVLSPAFLYYLERLMDDFWATNNRWPTNDELLAIVKTNPAVDDTGSSGRTSLRTMNQFGVCTLDAEPYSDADFTTPPTDAQIAEALLYKSGAYHRISIVQDMKSCLASLYVFAIGFTVFQSFESDQMASDGIWSPDKANESILGYHEPYVIGYDDSVNGGSFKVRNSWSAAWGDKGNFWLRYQDAGDSDILLDAWMQHLGPAW
jgi:hypothetical protein